MPITVTTENNSGAPNNLQFFAQPRPQVDEVGEVLESLSQTPPRLSPKYFYDADGSNLFESITDLPEYYPTRTEARIFDDNLESIVAALGSGDILIEPGSGSCEKARRLLTAAHPAAYVPIDISADFLHESALGIAVDYPALTVVAIAADFTQRWDFAEDIPRGRRIVFYPGSTLGNLEPDEARAFIKMLAQVVGSEGGVLLGIDLHKDSAVLEAAYDDSAGVTAAFNKNMLNVVNSHTGADFKADQWRHQAVYNREYRRIEMTLISTLDQRVRIGDTVLSFPEGSEIRTEHSYKYTLESLQSLAQSAGLGISHRWLDEQSLFCVALLEAQPNPTT